MPILPKASFVLRFSAALFVLPNPSSALPPDDFHLFVTVFVVLFLSAVVISFGFGASLYFYWRKKRAKENWRANAHKFGSQWAKEQSAAKADQSNYPNWSPLSVQLPPKPSEAKFPSKGISLANRFLAFCSSAANAFGNVLRKISNLLKTRGQIPTPTHFPSESPPPSYISVTSPSELSPQQYHKFPPSLSQNGRVPSSSRLKSILKKPKTVSAGFGIVQQRRDTVLPAATVSYRIPVLRAQNVQPPVPRASPPQVPRKWEWNAHLREIPSGDRVIEDRVEREECLRNGRLMAVERLTRTIRASADIGGAHAATYI